VHIGSGSSLQRQRSFSESTAAAATRRQHRLQHLQNGCGSFYLSLAADGNIDFGVNRAVAALASALQQQQNDGGI
jgi:hypothetical protein